MVALEMEAKKLARRLQRDRPLFGEYSFENDWVTFA